MVNGKYEDPSFPANESSLFWNVQNDRTTLLKAQTFQNLQFENKDFKWVRPTDMKNNKLNPGADKLSLYGQKGV